MNLKTRYWISERERGNLMLLRLVVWLSLLVGRRLSRVLLWPITIYFYCVTQHARSASRAYLRRVVKGPVEIGMVLRHIHTFASVLLDRIFFISGKTQDISVSVEGQSEIEVAIKRGQGIILLGAHFGSFEAVRALGHSKTEFPLVLLMYQKNAQNISKVLSAINPELNQEIIALGEPDCMIKVQKALSEGAIVGILADRTVKNERLEPLRFLNGHACFSDGPLRLAAALKVPVFMMIGAYEGGAGYHVNFHSVFDFSVSSASRASAIQQAQSSYIQLLEGYCRRYPYNWFNFYNFWEKLE